MLTNRVHVDSSRFVNIYMRNNPTSSSGIKVEIIYFDYLMVK